MQMSIAHRGGRGFIFGCLTALGALLLLGTAFADKAKNSSAGVLSDSDWIMVKGEQGPNQVIATDLESDGVLDLVTVNSSNNTISVMKTQGNGLISLKTKITAPGQTPYSVAAGRLSGGRYPDLVVANLGSSNLSIFYADGQGGFKPGVQVATEKAPIFVVTADLDGDGLDDIAVLNMEKDTVTVYFNNPNHDFKPDLVLNAGKSPVFLAAEDVNGDGRKDLITANNEGGNISVFLNNGHRTFAEGMTFETGAGPVALGVADFNGDGFPDIATANEDAGTVTLLLGQGNGQFKKGNEYSVRHPQTIAVADIDGAKKPAVIVSERETGTLAILSNRGDGSLADPVRIRPDGEHLTSLVTADLNHDGKIDIVGASFISGNVAVLLQGVQVPRVESVDPNQSHRVHAVGNGLDRDIHIQFSTAMSPSSLTNQTVLVYGSMSGYHKTNLTYDAKQHLVTLKPTLGLFGANRDNRFKIGELVTVTLTDGVLSSEGIPMKHGYIADFEIKPTAGTGQFQEDQRVSCVKVPGRLRAADMDNDNHVDVVAMCREVDSVRLYFNDGKGHLGHSVTLPTKGNGPWDLWVADLNRDGIMDIAIVNTFTSDLIVMYGLGDHKFASPSKIASGAGPMGVIAADVNADGWLDLVTVTKGGPEALVFMNDHKGGFEKPVSYKVSPSPYHLTARDINGDGSVDLMMTNLESDRGTILLNNGDGTFSEKQEFPLLLAKALVADVFSPVVDPGLNKGFPGIITVNTASDDISIFLSDGMGQFKQPIKVSVGATPTDQVVGDFNADGFPDVAVTLDGGKVAVLLNDADNKGGVHKVAEIQVGDNPTSPILGDFNEDGTLDMIVANQYSHDISVLLNPPNAAEAAKMAAKIAAESKVLRAATPGEHSEH
ncbi:MAG TPA: FG-GAP-like repeat-containing protein [Candidatus Angelobacter sp.]|nr:FG-GAP-like repeat-containing protein [Candidatus Angelobacter sp.]